MLRGEHEVAFPPQRFGGGRLLLLKEDALVPVPFPPSSSFMTELANAVINGMVMFEKILAGQKIGGKVRVVKID